MYCLNLDCSCKLCLHKKTSSLSRIEYQSLQCASVCQVRKIPFEDQTNALFLKFSPGVCFSGELKISFQAVIGAKYCPTCPNEKCVYLSTSRKFSFYVCKKCKTCSQDLNSPFKDQNSTFMLFGGDEIHYFARKMGGDIETGNPSPLLIKILSQSQPITPELQPKTAKINSFLA